MKKPCKFCNLAVGEMKSIAAGRSIRPLNILHETPKRWRLVSTPNKNIRLTESVPIYRCPRCGRDLIGFNVASITRS